MYNPHKTISATDKGINICYLDNKKHMFKTYENAHLSKIQIEGTAQYQEFEKQVFNPVQKKMYNQLVYGFSVFTEEEMQKLHPRIKKHIKIRYTKTQVIINQLKQKIVNNSVNQLFIKVFPKSPVTKKLVHINGYHPDYLCKLTFKELGISSIMIAEYLVKYSLLPKNFFQLK
jgi:hypothetical protein